MSGALVENLKNSRFVMDRMGPPACGLCLLRSLRKKKSTGAAVRPARINLFAMDHILNYRKSPYSPGGTKVYIPVQVQAPPAETTLVQ